MIRWVYAFVDRPRESFERAAEFWTAVTDTALSPRRGEDGEFATLLPGGGADACVKLQGGGGHGAHLDFHVDDVRAWVDHAEAAGARVVADHGRWAVLASPSGQQFCVGAWAGEKVRPEVFDGTRLDQVCVDIAPEAFEEESTFWGTLTGWPVLTGSRSEFRVVKPPADLPVRILLQRLDAPRATGAHLDFACEDREAARAAHEKRGATFVAAFSHWTVMRDPSGGVYCLTARDPHTGALK
ncbi:VOC family protein [Streptacidiphilus rugosus]|uniref:VOC family protein n=1 Tax=Streptacidiphilus rugosus TaxID=405783 RepID=UPI00055F1BD9|nr:VOC family protein [Streptacidiphilus rugosus]